MMNKLNLLTYLLIFSLSILAWGQDSPYRYKTFPPEYQPDFGEFATIETVCNGVPVWDELLHTHWH